MADYFVHYSEANIVCLIIFAIMLGNNLINTDRQEKLIRFDWALGSFMLYFVSDILWSAVIAGFIPNHIVVSTFFNALNYVVMVLVVYMWLRYVMASVNTKDRNKPINRLLLLLPFLIVSVTMIVMYLIDRNLLLGPDLKPTVLYMIFLVIVPAIYIAVVLVLALKKAIVEPNPLERAKQLQLAIVPLVVVAGGLVQVFLLPDIPIYCFCCTVLMLFFYIKNMERRISADGLTGLNNRGQLIKLASQSNIVREDGLRTFVTMVDVNNFKRINDTFGHAEGDCVLTLIADSMKTVVNRFSASSFICRYGGDEFVMILYLQGEEQFKLLCKALREEITNRCKAHTDAYVVTVGIGYEEMVKENTFQMCLKRADENMYLDKERVKAGMEETVA